MKIGILTFHWSDNYGAVIQCYALQEYLKSNLLVKNYAENLGYEYLTASNKDEFKASMGRFLMDDIAEKPILIEVFTETDDESNALEMTLNCMIDFKTEVKNKLRKTVKDVIGQKGIDTIKKVIKFQEL